MASDKGDKNFKTGTSSYHKINGKPTFVDISDFDEK